MRHLFKKVAKKTALPPGTLIHVGEKKTDATEIGSLQYNAGTVKEQTHETVDELKILEGFDGISWININGIHDTGVIGAIGTSFRINPLVQEDILNTLQRPKIEDFGDYIYLVLKMLDYDREKKAVNKEQVSFVLTGNTVISFQEKPGDVFDSVRKRIVDEKRKIRTRGPDYLLYALIDAVVDHYFLIMENISEDIEEIEDELMIHPESKHLHRIQHLRKELILLRKAVWPMRDILNTILRDDLAQIKESSHVYYRDVHDHTIQVIETTETFRDIVSGLQDMYMSSISNRMNEIMKVLTMIATLFIPLTFIAGIYGMNFEFMPELKWRYAYFGVWGIMVLVTLMMIVYFKRKKWF